MTDIDFKLSPYDSAEYLDSDEAIMAYLEEALKTDDAAFITHALGIVARTRGTQIAKKTGLTNDRLRKALSHEGNPKFGTIVRVMQALGLSFSVTPAEPARGIAGGVFHTLAVPPSPDPAPAASRRRQARGDKARRSADRLKRRRPRRRP